MDYSAQSKKTYKTAINAKKACLADGKKYNGVHELPSGRWSYVFIPACFVETFEAERAADIKKRANQRSNEIRASWTAEQASTINRLIAAGNAERAKYGQ